MNLTTVYYMRLDRAQFIFFFKFDSKDSTLAQPYSTIRSMLRRQREPDEGPMLETLDYTIRTGSTPTFLYFDLK